MGEWIIGACINFVGSIGINFGTNLLKLGHNQVSLGRRSWHARLPGKSAWQVSLQSCVGCAVVHNVPCPPQAEMGTSSTTRIDRVDCVEQMQGAL
jgi:hypothetical protein